MPRAGKARQSKRKHFQNLLQCAMFNRADPTVGPNCVRYYWLDIRNPVSYK